MTHEVTPQLDQTKPSEGASIHNLDSIVLELANLPRKDFARAGVDPIDLKMIVAPW